MRVLPLLAIATLVGCAAGRRDLQSVADAYVSEAPQARARAASVVLLPGISGNAIVDPTTGERYWGSFFGDAPHPQRDPDDLRMLALPVSVDAPLSQLDDELVAGEPLLLVELHMAGLDLEVRGYPGAFEGLMDRMGDPHVRTRHDLHLPVDAIARGDLPITEHGYDWRRDISLEAADLHARILEAIAAAPDADHRVDLVAHSMGGLLARWYLRYGAQPLPDDGSLPELTWEGTRYVRRLLLAGTPSGGSAQVLEVLLKGEKPHPLIPAYPPALLGTFPALYQMLPRTRHGLVTVEGTGEVVDLFDVAVWDRFGWGLLDPDQADVLADLLPDVADPRARRALARAYVEACLDRAQSFQAALDRPAEPPPWTHVHLFAGDTRPTRSHLAVDPATGHVRWVGHEPGDGEVTRRSALMDERTDDEVGRLRSPVDWHTVHFQEADHFGLVSHPDFLDDAFFLLLEAPDPAPSAPEPE